VDGGRLKRGLIPWTVLGAAGLAAFLVFFRAAFPTASLDLKVDRTDAESAAIEFLRDRGLSLESYTGSTVFGGDQMAAVFLQRTLGMESANELMKEKIPVWRWRSRWFRSAEKEEMTVVLGAGGDLLGFSHAIEEAASGADLSPDSAKVVAESFLGGLGVDLAALETVEASSEKKENRTDHYLEWKVGSYSVQWDPEDPEAGEATLRHAVRVQGDEIGYYSHYLKVPERFSRNVERQTGLGQLLTVVSFVLILLTIIAAGVMIVLRARGAHVPWRMFVSISIITGTLALLNVINSFPVAKISYPTEWTYGTYIGFFVVGAVVGALAYALWVLLTGMSGHVMASDAYPRSLGSIRDMAEGRIASPRVGYSCLIGYGLGLFFLGYLTVFYLFGRKFLGVWLPAESPYSNVVSYYMPWLAPLAVSLMAALSEEFTSRYFSISFLKKYLRLTPLALLLPAVIWAFAHSSYQVFPVYVRGIELTIGGMIFGIVFIKYDILACIVGHYVVDAVLFAMPLVNSQDEYLKVSGYVVIGLGLAPLLLGLVGIGKGSSGPEATAGAGPSVISNGGPGRQFGGDSQE
jgi:hypothetical protein